MPLSYSTTGHLSKDIVLPCLLVTLNWRALTRGYSRVDGGLVLDAVIAIRMHMGLVIVIRELMGRISEC